jgi:group I intron endonuclease
MIKRECIEIIIGIYKITNPQGKVYIGQSKDIFARFHQYHREDKRSMGVKLAESIDKYGSDNHFYEIVEECDITLLDEREKFYINQLNTKENGLNSTIGGNGLIQHSLESRRAISNARKGQPSPLKGRTRSYKGRVSPVKGYKRTPQSIKSQIEKMTGKKQSGVHIKNILTGKEWISASQCALDLEVSVPTILTWAKIGKNNLTLI